MWGGKRNPELHQEPRDPGSEDNAWSFEALQIRSCKHSACCDNCGFCFRVSGDEDNLLQLSAATINAEWLTGSVLGQPCQGSCTPGSCSVCSEQKQPAEGCNAQKLKVEQMRKLWIPVDSCLSDQVVQMGASCAVIALNLKKKCVCVSVLPRCQTSRRKSSSGKRRKSVKRSGIGKSFYRVKEARTRTRTCKKLWL